MNVDQLNRWLTLVANIGVIAGIAFLALELRQNNELLTAQVRVARHDLRSADSTRLFLQNPEMAKLIVKIQSDQTLAADEQYIADRFFEQVLLNWQFVYVEYRRGLLEQTDMPTAGWNSYFSEFPGMAAYWEQAKSTNFRQDFAAWLDEEVLR